MPALAEADLKRLLDRARKPSPGGGVESSWIRGAADRERGHARAVESNLQLLRLRHATDRPP